jgi:kynurenine formamidase
VLHSVTQVGEFLLAADWAGGLAKVNHFDVHHFQLAGMFDTPFHVRRGGGPLGTTSIIPFILPAYVVTDNKFGVSNRDEDVHQPT